MEKIFGKWGMVISSAMAGVAVAVSIVSCGSSGGGSATYTQIERLGRPGINEALVVTPAFLDAFNAIGPSLDLSTSAAAVRTEVVNVLTGLYAYACNAGLSPLVACPSGTTVFEGDNKTLTSAVKTAATTYATKVAGHFLPDVLRINTDITSEYDTDAAELCNALADDSPALCGGRYITDDTIDVTYRYLLNGGTPASIVQDGVSYAGAGGNKQQGHQTPDSTFPFVPAPY